MGSSRTSYGKRKTRTTAKVGAADTSQCEKSPGSPSPTGSSNTIDPTTDNETLSEGSVIGSGDGVSGGKGLKKIGGVGDLENSDVEELPDVAHVPKSKGKSKKAAKKTAPEDTSTPTSTDMKPKSE
jgi:hypothetical protein